MKSRRNFIIGLSIGALIIIGVCSAGVYIYLRFAVTYTDTGPAFDGNTCDPKTPANTEDVGQFKFPPSMTNLRSECSGMQGWGGTAQFEMSSSDLEYFVSHLQIKPPLCYNRIPADNELATKASTLKTFLYGSYHTLNKGHSFSQEVMIDTSDPRHFMVYLSFLGG